MVLVILGLALGLRLIALNQSFWLDEAAQAVLSAKPITNVNYAADFQPPLYYIFSHYWMNIGAHLGTHSEWFLRLPSVIFAILTIYLVYRFFGELLSKQIGLISAILLATAPFHIYYSQEFRMYSLLTLFGILSWMLLWKKQWLLYGIIIGLAVLTHYFAFVLLLSQVIFILLYQRDYVKHLLTSRHFLMSKRFLVSAGIGLFSFLIWLPTFLKQIETSRQLVHAWPRWAALSNTSFLKFPGLVLAKFTVGMISPENKMLYGITVGIVAMICLLAFFKIIFPVVVGHKTKRFLEDKPLMLLFIYSLVPFFIAWVGGLFISANTPWRIQFILPAFYALIAVGIEKWDNRRTRYVFVAPISILIVLNILFSTQYLFNVQYHRENWRDAVAYTDTLAKKNNIILTEFIGPWAPIEWYSTRPNKYIGASTQQHMTITSVQKKLDPLISLAYIQSYVQPYASTFIKPDKIILYTYLFEISDPNKLVEQYLQKDKYNLAEEKDFRGVGIIKTYAP